MMVKQIICGTLTPGDIIYMAGLKITLHKSHCITIKHAESELQLACFANGDACFIISQNPKSPASIIKIREAQPAEVRNG